MSRRRRNGTLPDVLLVRVRELLQAEYATLWLPAQGRYPEVLLSARVDDPGLLDVANTPAGRCASGRSPTARPSPSAPGSATPALRAVMREQRGQGRDRRAAALRLGRHRHARGRRPAGRHAAVRPGRRAAAGDARRARRRRGRELPPGRPAALRRLPRRAHRRCPTAAASLGLLEEAVKVRAPGEVVAVLLFDIDGLRDVNDSLGHDAGDQHGRRGGRAGCGGWRRPPRWSGRVGSDEFVVTLRLPDADEAARARRPSCAPRCRSRWRSTRSRSTWTSRSASPCTRTTAPSRRCCSSGPTWPPRRPSSSPTPVQLFHPSLEARSTRRLGPRRRPAPGAGARARSRSTSSPRWPCPTGGWSGWSAWPAGSTRPTGRSPPTDFVAVAEHTGQLGRLTEVVLREGLRRAPGLAGRRPAAAGRGQPLRPYPDRPDVPGPGRPSCSTSTACRPRCSPWRSPRTAWSASPTGRCRRCAGSARWASGWPWTTSAPATRRCRTCAACRSHEVKIDRSFVQGMATDAGRPGDRAGGGGPGPALRPGRGGRGRGERADASACSRSWAATSARASCSAGRCRTSGSRPGSRPRPSRSPTGALGDGRRRGPRSGGCARVPVAADAAARDLISRPVRRRVLLPGRSRAPLAQSAERLHGKEKVYGSIP